jgi:hypothetical protein
MPGQIIIQGQRQICRKGSLIHNYDFRINEKPGSMVAFYTKGLGQHY